MKPRPRIHRLAAGFGFTLAAVLTFYRLIALPGTGTPPVCPEHERIQVAAGRDVSVGGYRRALFERWNAENDPGQKDVDVVELSPTADEATSEMLAALQGDQCPRYDVVVLDVAVTPEFAAAGLLEDLGEVGPGRFVPAALATGEWEGTQYALPFATDVGLLFRRPGAARPAGWAELWQRAAPRSLVAQTADYEGGTVHLLEAAAAGGGRLVRDGEPAIDRAARQSLAAWWQASQSDRYTEGQLKEQESLSAFVAGEGTYLRHWPYARFKLAAAGVDVEVSALPGAALGGSNLAIAARSGLKAESRAFIERMTEVTAQQELFSCGGYAPVVEAAYSAVKPCALPVDEEEAGPAIGPAELKAYLEVIRAALRGAERPKLAHYGQFSKTLRACVRDVREKGHDSGAAFAETLARELGEVLPDAIAGKPGP
ncbi:extracellular solute-binding protein, partial [Nonomuraea sp. NN258]|uniref:extracellular solute-binding protein n=1 Tax=Nonomuraea antri TaxID=2730852 RepID=UPI00156819D7